MDLIPHWHLILHLLFPLLAAGVEESKNGENRWTGSWRDKASSFFSGKKRVFFIYFSANLIDIDHLFAGQIYDPARCSIGFHPLHSMPAFPFYIIALFIPSTTRLSIGVFLHLFADLIDCYL